ncbi:hypothetical protein N431DRAFT_465334 [Stipitochalara longipes BDJ]|nr:hypothetical protein N431DRAFT_465334 [Stipitochalara longipes BDJ]
MSIRSPYPRVNTEVRQPSLQIPRIISSTSSTTSDDELFFDCTTPNPDRTEEASSPSYLVFEPVVSTVSEQEPTDWRRYEPPSELLIPQDETSEVIRGLLKPSITRIQARHVEEEERRITHARRERPISRVGRASGKPRRESLMSGGLDPLQHDRSRLSAGSASSLLSDDSGYASMSPAEVDPPSPKSSTKRSFGLGALFKRKDRSIHESHSIVESASPSAAQPATPIKEVVEETSLTTECVSCLEDLATEEMIKLTCHSYCRECFQRLMSTALETEAQWPAKCCLNTIPSEKILPNINITMKIKYQEREAEWSIPTADRVYCSARNCSAWIPPKNINNQRQCATCPKCSKKTCSICRGVSHNGTDCPQDPGLQATVNLAETEGWKRCYSCRAFVEHNKGCRHMTCRCKAEFCYICGLRWRTCACTDALLANVQQEATARRQAQVAQTARQREAAEEERLVLQMVADFERREAERLAAEAEAQRRRDEAERIAREEERRRREEMRIAGISLRFRTFNALLEALHDIQRVHIAERYESEVNILKKERQDSLDTFSIRHPAEIQQLTTESQKRISDSEYKFEQEYKLRLAEERRIEDEYVDQLRVYWQGKPDAEYKVREARDELRADQDKEYRFWDSYRRKQLQDISEGEKKKMEALVMKHKAEIKAVEGRSKIDEVEWKRKKWAEGKWVEEVVRERIAILQEMEQAEYARSE